MYILIGSLIAAFTVSICLVAHLHSELEDARKKCREMEHGRQMITKDRDTYFADRVDYRQWFLAQNMDPDNIWDKKPKRAPVKKASSVPERYTALEKAVNGATKKTKKESV